jgi:hypothetical protein
MDLSSNKQPVEHRNNAASGDTRGVNIVNVSDLKELQYQHKDDGTRIVVESVALV